MTIKDQTIISCYFEIGSRLIMANISCAVVMILAGFYFSMRGSGGTPRAGQGNDQVSLPGVGMLTGHTGRFCR